MENYEKVTASLTDEELMALTGGFDMVSKQHIPLVTVLYGVMLLYGVQPLYGIRPLCGIQPETLLLKDNKDL